LDGEVIARGCSSGRVACDFAGSALAGHQLLTAFFLLFRLDAGSAFTVALTRLWYRQDVTFTTWRQFFSKLRPETNTASAGQHRARAFHLGDETPAAPPAAGKLGL
jgi:hypothetical protein